MLGTSHTFQVVEGTERVSYFVRTGEGTFASPLAVPNAKRRAPTKDETGPDGALLVGTGLIWHVWAQQLFSVVPKVGDVVQDRSAMRFIVCVVETQSFGRRYRLTTQREQ
jgi:hypothetical protein